METAVEKAREALARCDWAAAYELVAGTARDSDDPETLEVFGDAAWWTSYNDNARDAH
ncbi:MAG: hypothetical protein H0V95_09995 [Actinobacteria bacterium]|nr:hypothetical protein [Actinomycetota bacterium]